MAKKDKKSKNRKGECLTASTRTFSPEVIEKRANRICKHHYRRGVSMEIARSVAVRALIITKEKIKAYQGKVPDYIKRQYKDGADA
ncbi:MAG: hypothetical protein AAF988_07550, partial [Pseudomonadota bacterium]